MAKKKVTAKKATKVVARKATPKKVARSKSPRHQFDHEHMFDKHQNLKMLLTVFGVISVLYFLLVYTR